MADEKRERPTMGRIRELEAEVAALKAKGAEDMVSLPAEAFDAILDEMEGAGRKAAEDAEALRRNSRATYTQRLHKGFLDGTAKTCAYFLGKFEELDH